jgi:hypothetical protein
VNGLGLVSRTDFRSKWFKLPVEICPQRSLRLWEWLLTYSTNTMTHKTPCFWVSYGLEPPIKIWLRCFFFLSSLIRYFIVMSICDQYVFYLAPLQNDFFNWWIDCGKAETCPGLYLAISGYFSWLCWNLQAYMFLLFTLFKKNQLTSVVLLWTTVACRESLPMLVRCSISLWLPKTHL